MTYEVVIPGSGRTWTYDDELLARAVAEMLDGFVLVTLEPTEHAHVVKLSEHVDEPRCGGCGSLLLDDETGECSNFECDWGECEHCGWFGHMDEHVERTWNGSGFTGAWIGGVVWKCGAEDVDLSRDTLAAAE